MFGYESAIVFGRSKAILKHAGATFRLSLRSEPS